MRARCGTCKFWAVDVDLGVGQCRRHAPRPITERGLPLGKAYTAGVLWPVTNELDVCGEWKPE